jgi:nucleoside-diphosphate-sugar epimerase
MKVILTGATGMVGEAVLLECLNNSAVTEVLMINRRPSSIQHPKLKELLLADFTKLAEHSDTVKNYDACFYCAGVSSIGMNEKKYTAITYDTTMAFAKVLAGLNTNMVFCFVTGSQTDSSEKGRMMWARVKGRTENDLMKLPFSGQYNFRPGIMTPYPGQKNSKAIYTFIAKLVKAISPKRVCSLQEVGQAMINTLTKGYPKQILEIADIKELAKA